MKRIEQNLNSAKQCARSVKVENLSFDKNLRLI